MPTLSQVNVVIVPLDHHLKFVVFRIHQTYVASNWSSKSWTNIFGRTTMP